MAGLLLPTAIRPDETTVQDPPQDVARVLQSVVLAVETAAATETTAHLDPLAATDRLAMTE